MTRAAPRRGYLYWIHLDKRRPALVLSPDYRNERAHDVIVVPCSTTLREAPTHVRLRRGQGGVSADSMLKCEQIATLALSDVLEPLGRPLPESVVRAVERGVLRAIGIPVEPEPS